VNPGLVRIQPSTGALTIIAFQPTKKDYLAEFFSWGRLSCDSKSSCFFVVNDNCQIMKCSGVNKKKKHICRVTPHASIGIARGPWRVVADYYPNLLFINDCRGYLYAVFDPTKKKNQKKEKIMQDNSWFIDLEMEYDWAYEVLAQEII